MPVISILHITAPLLVVTMGALISEYAGRMAMFLEYIINLGAFFCFAFTILTHNIAAAFFLSVLSCTLITIIFERLATRSKANMFFVSLALNMLYGASTTLFSSLFFGTRGVLYSELFSFEAPSMRIATSILCYAFAFLQIAMLVKTTPGLTLRITGSNADMLRAQGISVSFYKMLSWIFAAADGALCGCVLAARLSSFVPGMSSGRGWTALAAVFLGKKHPFLVALSVAAFALAEWLSTNIQNIAMFKNVPHSLLLALPYLLSLLLIIAVPQKAE